MPCHDSRGPDVSRPDPEMEKDLCEARWIIGRLAAYEGNLHQGDPVLRRLIDTHLKAQRAHRIEDRAFVVRKMEQDLNEKLQNIDKIRDLGGEPRKAVIDACASIRANIKALLSMTDEELMDNYWDTDPCVPHRA